MLKFKCAQDKARPQYNESDELGLPPTGCGVTLLSRDDAAGILVLWGGRVVRGRENQSPICRR